MAKQHFQITIPKRGKSCLKSGTPFEAGALYHSVVLENSDGEWIRLDYLEEAWDDSLLSALAEEHETTEKKITHWVSRVPESRHTSRPADQTKEEYTLELFREALQQEKKEEAFVLALFLARHKQLALRKEEKKHHLYEAPSTEEMFTVPLPTFDTLNVEKIQKKLAEKLSL